MTRPNRPEIQAIRDRLPQIFAALPPIFGMCVDGNQMGRYDLWTPWRDEDFVYAGDGRILVRVPSADVPTATRLVIPTYADGKLSYVKAKAVRDLFDPESLYEPMPIPEEVGEPLGSCWSCKGTGRIPATLCESCDGDGCGFCDEQGCFPVHECPDCKGSKIGRPWMKCVRCAEGVEFDHYYLGILKKFGMSLYVRIDRQVAAARFAGGNVEGRLMPLQPEK